MKNSTPVKSCQVKSVKSSKKYDNGEQIGSALPCQYRQCPHHVFHEAVFRDPSNNVNGQPTHLTPHETDKSREFNNCMIQLNRGLTLEEIGEMYGVSGRRAIVSIIKLAMRHIKQNKKALRELQEYE